VSHYKTAGEIMLQRSLEVEKRAGVPHYVSGQHHAEVIMEDTCLYAMLSWVDDMGHVIAMPCRREKDGEWKAMGIARRSGVALTQPPQEVAEVYGFSDKQLAALKEAEERHAL
jgi:hypothetical protein